MKIAVVSIGSFDTQYSDYHIMRDIIEGLLKRGHEVILYQKQYLDTPNYPDVFNPFLGKQLQVRNIRFTKKAKADLKARYIADLLYYRKACQLMKKDNPDKIFLQSNNTAFYTVFYAKHILKKPLLYNEQDIFPENAYFAGILSEKSLIYQVAHFLQKYAYKNANSLSTISDDMKHTIVSRYNISADKIQVIYNWGHEELTAHDDGENTFLKKYPKKANEFRVVYAGNLGKMQNVELVIQAATYLQEYKDITFYIIGGGANEDALKTYAQEKNLKNVVFVGMQPPEEVADLYKSADLNVIPLRTGLIYAALPSKTADCLMAGRDIITCFDDNSVFSQIMVKYGFDNSSPLKPKELAHKILLVKAKGLSCQPKLLWKKLFDCKKNVEKHAQCIEQMLNQ